MALKRKMDVTNAWHLTNIGKSHNSWEIFQCCDLFFFSQAFKFLAIFSAALDFWFFSSRKRTKRNESPFVATYPTPDTLHCNQPPDWNAV